MTFESFLARITEFLERSNIQYCFLRNYAGFPKHNVGNDIDILVSSIDITRFVEFAQAQKLQVTTYVDRGYVLSVFITGVEWDGRCAIEIDFVRQLSWKGLAYLRTSDVLVDVRRERNIMVPSLRHEALVSFFSSYLIGGWIKEKYWSQVRETFSAHGENIAASLIPLIGGSVAGDLRRAILADDSKFLLAMLPRLRRSLLFRAFSKSLFSSAGCIIRYHAREVLLRWIVMRPFVVCLLGPDGAGKSTIIQHLGGKLTGISKEIKVRHLKPQVLYRRANTAITVDPHGTAPRSTVESWLKLMVWLVEMWLDWLLLPTRDCTIQIYDRYYHDVIVDPLRYRYGGPAWLSRFVGKLVPKPDLVILLDAPENTVFQRKQELTLSELSRQRSAYRDLIKCFKRAITLDGSQPILRVTENAFYAITSAMASRALKNIECQRHAG